jgi:tetratricopeptide (TPR) repeat protein
MTGRRKTWLLIALVLFVGQAILEREIAPERSKVVPGALTGAGPGEAISQGAIWTAMSGFREVIAAILWVRADSYFHSGRYQEIVPLCRIITWLDPHEIDVYATGYWHMGWNFVDSQERSDRRYLPEALEFLKDGIKNNWTVYDLYHEAGFTYLDDKTRKYEQSTQWFLAARARGEKPAYQHLIPHSLEHQARIAECIAWWRKLLKETESYLRSHPGDAAMQERKETIIRNLDLTIWRMYDREDLPTRRLDAQLVINYKRLGPKKFKIYGTTKLPETARLYVSFRDADYLENLNSKSFPWRLKHASILEEGLFVLDKDMKFRPSPSMSIDDYFKARYTNPKYLGDYGLTYDLGADPQFYPLKCQQGYLLTVTFNPRSAPIPLQDRLGWSGEGLDDKNYLVELKPPGEVPLRVLSCLFVLDKDLNLVRTIPRGDPWAAMPGVRYDLIEYDSTRHKGPNEVVGRRIIPEAEEAIGVEKGQ